MNRTALSMIGIGALTLCQAPFAHATPPMASADTVYATVDSVEIGPYSTTTVYLDVEGIVQGESEPTTARYYFLTVDNGIGHACHKQALMAMNRPGRYLFELRADPAPSSFFQGCKLKRQ